MCNFFAFIPGGEFSRLWTFSVTNFLFVGVFEWAENLCETLATRELPFFVGFMNHIIHRASNLAYKCELNKIIFIFMCQHVDPLTPAIFFFNQLSDAVNKQQNHATNLNTNVFSGTS